MRGVARGATRADEELHWGDALIELLATRSYWGGAIIYIYIYIYIDDRPRSYWGGRFYRRADVTIIY